MDLGLAHESWGPLDVNCCASTLPCFKVLDFDEFQAVIVLERAWVKIAVAVTFKNHFISPSHRGLSWCEFFWLQIFLRNHFFFGKHLKIMHSQNNDR